MNHSDTVADESATISRSMFRQRGDRGVLGRMQVELLNTRRWATTFELVLAMANWIDTFYNTDRVHSYIGNISPDQYEALWASSHTLQLQ